ncbi:related to theta class glutathione S-transferase [Cephalotrichum gorgonifer]|uniref:glutathione transferase n=1 Tax=Cephalotrichum gorgonifer TaxID=2041049 RepID=A0AAE8SY66_9PEZI|nr:related to theta class glutathione S-transferase [Cephalotrichum gorgonifer]
MQPITLWSHHSGPNPWKVALIMEELGIPYKATFVTFAEVKNEPYVLINPNGRLPAIEDPNTGLTLWESGAIVEYLIEQYDKEHKLSYDDTTNKYLCKQWLHFQVSGQGPYYGQAFWFLNYASEKLPLAIDRYLGEIDRVTSVLERALDGRDWLVGDKCTYADLSFIAWQRIVPRLLGDSFYDKYPRVKAWLDRMHERPLVVKINEERRAAGIAAGGIP